MPEMGPARLLVAWAQQCSPRTARSVTATGNRVTNVDEVTASDAVPGHLEMSSGLALPSSLDQPAAEMLCRRLQEHLLAGGPLQIDGSAVSRASATCVQVLVAAACSARTRGLGFELINPSPALAEALTQLGLQSALAG